MLANNSLVIRVTSEYPWDNVSLDNIPKRRVCRGPQEATLAQLLLQCSVIAVLFNHYLWLTYIWVFICIDIYVPHADSVHRARRGCWDPPDLDLLAGVSCHVDAGTRPWVCKSSKHPPPWSHLSNPYYCFFLCLVYKLIHGYIWVGKHTLHTRSSTAHSCRHLLRRGTLYTNI